MLRSSVVAGSAMKSPKSSRRCETKCFGRNNAQPSNLINIAVNAIDCKARAAIIISDERLSKLYERIACPTCCQCAIVVGLLVPVVASQGSTCYARSASSTSPVRAYVHVSSTGTVPGIRSSCTVHLVTCRRQVLYVLGVGMDRRSHTHFDLSATQGYHSS